MNEQAQRERERLRDEFAAAALTGLLTSAGYPAFSDDYRDKIVRRAYEFADAALAHRDANPLPVGESPKAPQ